MNDLIWHPRASSCLVNSLGASTKSDNRENTAESSLLLKLGNLTGEGVSMVEFVAERLPDVTEPGNSPVALCVIAQLLMEHTVQ
jgi:hypothetical protein